MDKWKKTVLMSKIVKCKKIKNKINPNSLKMSLRILETHLNTQRKKIKIKESKRIKKNLKIKIQSKIIKAQITNQ